MVAIEEVVLMVGGSALLSSIPNNNIERMGLFQRFATNFANDIENAGIQKCDLGQEFLIHWR